MKFIDIALKDFYQLFKDWKPLIFLVIAPILFTLMFGFMFGGFSGPGSTDQRLPVIALSEEDTQLTETILAAFSQSQVIRLEMAGTDASLESLREAVADEDYAAVLILPAGFSQQIRDNGEVTLTAILDENSTAGISIQQEIITIANRMQTAANAATEAAALYTQQAETTDNAEMDAIYDDTFAIAMQAWESPPVTTLETQTAPNGSQQSGDENAFAQSLPGMMAQFAIAGLMGAAEIIIQERKSGALDRMMGMSVRRGAVLAGHWLAMFGMIFLQFIVLVTFGQLFLRLDFLASPLVTLALSVASCAFVASLGLLIGILAKMPEQSAIFALIPMFIFSGLGGAWVPLEILGESVQKIARFTPVYWIMTGFRDILLRGAGLINIWPSILALLGFTALFLVPAVLLFNKE
ncbi:ABC transporter permease [Chloroflexota bacterium]|nr:ABC transporter permease [Chloroflexota bacterium]